MPDERRPSNQSTVIQTQSDPVSTGATHAPTKSGAPAPLPAVPGYTVSREIARGGMGVVYRAHDSTFGREVAIKVMHPGQDTDRFVVESRITAQLPHPGIPPVYALGLLPDRRPFLVMKLIQGRTLAGELRRAADADLPRLLGVFEQICQTVGFAHSRGVIHRDLKPSNVMVGAFGEVKVMDWGLAKSVAQHGSAGVLDLDGAAPPDHGFAETVAGSVKGTPAYMAPEQARGGHVDARADVFALGGLLAVILTGNPPFAGDTVLATVLMAAQAELDECFEELDDCGADEELVEIAKTCLAPRPADRYANGEEVAGAVAAYRAGVEERLRAAERDRAAAEVRAAEQRKRRKVQLALAACVLLLVAGGAGFAWWQSRQDTNRRLERQAAEMRAEGDRAAARATTEARARQAVESATVLATDLRNKFRFAEAATALDQAAQLTPADAPDDVKQRLAEARADLEFVRELDQILFDRVRADPTRGHVPMVAALHAAFAARGLDPTDRDPGPIVARIAASPIRKDLVRALDTWAWAASTSRNARLVAQLLAVSRGADPGEWSDRLRDPAVWTDRQAIARLGREIDPNVVPGHLIVVYLLIQPGAWPDGRRVLSVVANRDRDDFWVQFEAGCYYAWKDPWPAGSVAHMRAALALRPNHRYALHWAAASLQKMGSNTDAIACYRELTRLAPDVADFHGALGNLLETTGDIPGARAAFTEAARLDKRWAAKLATLPPDGK